MAGNITGDEADRLLSLSLEDGDLLALSTALSSDAAAGEEVSGSGYSRQTIDWTPGTGAERSVSTDILFEDMPSSTVIGWEVYASNGTDRKWWGLFGTEEGVVIEDNFIAIPGNTFVYNEPVIFQAGYSPDAVTPGDVYYVVLEFTTGIKISETPGGTVLDLDGDYRRVVLGRVYDVGEGSTFSIPSSSISLTLT